MQFRYHAPWHLHRSWSNDPYVFGLLSLLQCLSLTLLYDQDLRSACLIGAHAQTDESSANASQSGLWIDFMINDDSCENTDRQDEAGLVADDEAVQRSEQVVFVSVGNHTRRLLWYNGSLESLCSMIVDLYNARDASSFFSGLPLDMGLFLIEPWLAGNSMCERVVNPQEQLQDGSVVEVRNKLWRAVLKYSVGSTDEERAHDNETVHALRKYLCRVLTEPSSSRVAQCVAAARNISIILSSLNAIYMTLPDYRMRFSGSPAWPGPRGSHVIEAVCSLWFTAEVMMQMFAIASISILLRRTSFAVNSLAIVPWYSRLMGAGEARIFALLRLLQAMRTLTMIQSSQNLIKLMATTFRRAAHMLALLSCLISMFICMLAVVLWTVERGEWDSDSRMFLRRTGWSCPVVCNGPAWFGAYSGCAAAGDEIWMSSRDKIGRQQHLCIPVQEESPFSSMMACAWFCTVAVVTVGYGDMIPMTNLGRCITVTAMLMGVIVIALPITVVGSTFSATYSEMKDKAKRLNGSSSMEAAFFMSAVHQTSGGFAQQGCHGVRRPLRVKDILGVGTNLEPKDIGEQEHVFSAPGSGRQQVVLRPALDSSQPGQRSSRRGSLAVCLNAAKALLEPDAADASSDDEDSDAVIEQRYKHRRAIIENFLGLGMIGQEEGDSSNVVI